MQFGIILLTFQSLPPLLLPPLQNMSNNSYPTPTYLWFGTFYLFVQVSTFANGYIVMTSQGQVTSSSLKIDVLQYTVVSCWPVRVHSKK